MLTFSFIMFTLYSLTLFDIYLQNISLDSFAILLDKDENDSFYIKDIKLKNLYELQQISDKEKL